MIKLKRAYEKPSRDDGALVLKKVLESRRGEEAPRHE
jgi:hypothetical protein